jgi:hypothetical protein
MLLSRPGWIDGLYVENPADTTPTGSVLRSGTLTLGSEVNPRGHQSDSSGVQEESVASLGGVFFSGLGASCGAVVSGRDNILEFIE